MLRAAALAFGALAIVVLTVLITITAYRELGDWPADCQIVDPGWPARPYATDCTGI